MIGDVLRILIKRKRQIIITFLVIVFAVVTGTLLMPKEYETRMKILVKSDRVDGGSSSDVSEAQVNTEIELLNSNNLLEQVAKATGLQHLEHAGSVPARDRDAVSVEKAVRRLQHDLKITAVRKSDIIEVKYAATNPHFAAAVLRQFAQTYLDAHLRAHSMPGTYEFFSGQATRYRQELKTIEEEVANFQEGADVVLLAQQKEATLQKSMESQSDLLKTQAAINEHQSKIARINSQLGSVDGRVVTQSRVVSNQYVTERLNTMMAELQNRRTQLLTKFQPNDRSIKEVDQEIADTRTALERATKMTGLEQTTDVNPLRQNLEIDLAKEQADLAGAQARRQSLGSQEQGYRTQLSRLDGATAQYDDLLRHQKEVEENYLLYSKKSEEARIAESLDKQKISNVAIIETPSEPHLPTKPNVPLNLIIGTFLAACVSTGWALCAEFFKRGEFLQPQFGMSLPQPASPAGYPSVTGQQYLLNTVRSPADLEELTGLPVLALLDNR